MSVSTHRAVCGVTAIVAPFFVLFVACDSATTTPEATAGASSAGSGGSGVSGAAVGGSNATGGSSTTAGAGTAAGSGGAAVGGAGTASVAGTASGGMGGGGTAGMAGVGGSTVGGGASGAGGSGGAACGTLAKANDGSYIASAFTAEYTCTGGACPTKNGDDQGDVATNAFDDDYQSRWSTGVYQSALANQNKFPLYFTVDLQQAVPVSKLTTHPGCKDIFDSPGTIEVEVSTNGTDFTTITATPHTPEVPGNEACPPNGNAKATDSITFPTTCARYVRLKGTRRTSSDRYWAIGEMNIYP
jgi:hypothetical protein